MRPASERNENDESERKERESTKLQLSQHEHRTTGTKPRARRPQANSGRAGLRALALAGRQRGLQEAAPAELSSGLPLCPSPRKRLPKMKYKPRSSLQLRPYFGVSCLLNRAVRTTLCSFMTIDDDSHPLNLDVVSPSRQQRELALSMTMRSRIRNECG